MGAERFDDREYHLTGSRYYGIALDKVEKAVGIAFLVGIYTVEIHNLQQRLVVQSRHGKIVDLRSGGVGKIFDVQPELVFLNLVASEIIDIFHHQLPHRLFRRCRSAFEHLDIERLVGGSYVAGKFTDLIYLSAIGVLESYGQHLVGV